MADGYSGSREEDLVGEVIGEQSRMEIGRANFNTFWQEVALRVDPSTAYFTTPFVTPGTQRSEYMFDSTASTMLSRAVAVFESMCTPRTQKWHNLIPTANSLVDDHDTKVYLDAFRDLLFKARYSTKANFANQNSEMLRSFLCYGNGVLYVDDDPGVSLRYKAIHLGETWFTEDHNGRVDTVHRKFKLNAKQLVAQFEKSGKLPEGALEAARTTPAREFEVIHCCKPNPEYESRRMDWRGKKVVSYYVCQRRIMETSGHFTLPYVVARYRVNMREVYGRGPIMDVLPSIRTVNEQQKTNLKAGQRIATPPLLAHRDGIMGQVNLRSDNVNYGGIDDNGRQLIQPMKTADNLPVSLEMQQSEQNVIKDNLFADVFEALRDNPQMTATQALQLVQERGVLMSPPVGRLQTEAYGPMIEREIDLLSHVGGGEFLMQAIGAPPQQLRALGGNVGIEYDAPINREQNAAEGVAILNWINAITPLINDDPDAKAIMKPMDTIRELAKVFNVPAKLVATDEEIAAQKQAAATQAQISGLLAAAPSLTESAKNIAQANQIASQTGQQGMPGQSGPGLPNFGEIPRAPSLPSAA